MESSKTLKCKPRSVFVACCHVGLDVAKCVYMNNVTVFSVLCSLICLVACERNVKNQPVDATSESIIVLDAIKIIYQDRADES